MCVLESNNNNKKVSVTSTFKAELHDNVRYQFVCDWPLTSPCLSVSLSLDSESDSSDGSHRPSRDPAPPPQKHSSSNNKVSHTTLSFNCLLLAFWQELKEFD